jgi:hypothetical protein
MPNALELLKSDHAEVRKLLSQLEETTERAAKSRAKLLQKIGTDLRAHGKIEEDIFYPALREAARAENDKETLRMIAEAYEEHRAAVQLVLADLEATGPDTIHFSGRAKVLKELVEHHADEEEKEMFKAARELLDKETLASLGEEMEARKQSLVSRAGADGTPRVKAGADGAEGASRARAGGDGEERAKAGGEGEKRAKAGAEEAPRARSWTKSANG